MINYELEKMQGKYIIHKTGDNVPGKYGLYLYGIGRNNNYKWGYDYTYAKEMTLKTAKKHLRILQSI